MCSNTLPIKPMFDTNCENSCGLKYGIGESFERIVLEQQKINRAKGRFIPQIFGDPKDHMPLYQLYSHMLNDIMIKIFDSEDEQRVFRKSLQGMHSNYPEIFNGEEKNMFYAPASFNLDSRIKENESCVPDALEEMQTALESKQQLTSKEKRNLKKIRDHLQKLRPQLTEQEFVDGLACFFYNHRGIFIHSLKLDDHLKILTNKAREHRRQHSHIGFALTDFEKKLAEQLNISEQTLKDTADRVVTQLQSNKKVNIGTLLNGRLIRSSVDGTLKGNDKTFVKKLFKPGHYYSINDVKDGVMLGKLHSMSRVAGENDLLLMLPDLKVFLCIEIKRHTGTSVLKNENDPKIDQNMMSASDQLKKNSYFISRMHGAILSQGWEFVKVCAISPKVNNPEKICSNCKKFILTTNILKTPGGLKRWWDETGLSKRANMFDKKSKDASYNEFQLFFNRLICMSSVKVVPDQFHSWTQVQGNAPYHMSAGLTNTGHGIREKVASEGLDFEEALKAPHHAYKILFFNKDQMAILTTDTVPHIIFMNDFGAGK